MIHLYPMVVRDIMTPNPLTVREDTPLLEAAQLMLKNRFGGLPVVDAEGRLVGLVEVEDLLPRMSAVPFSDVRAMRLFDEWVDRDLASLYEELRQVPVAKALRKDVEVVHPDDPLDQALDRMAENRFRRMPVVDDAGRLVGILTRSDFLRLMLELGGRDAGR